MPIMRALPTLSRHAATVLMVAIACGGFASDALGQTAMTANPTIGKWKLDVPKSKNLSPTASTNVTRTFEDRGGGVVLATVEAFGTASEQGFSQYAVKYDGKYYPYQTRGSATANSIAYMPTDNPYHYEWYIKVDGVPSNRGETTISADGKTLTITNYTTVDDKPLTVVSVFDRVP